MLPRRDDPKARRPHELSPLVKLLRAKHPQHTRTREVETPDGAFGAFHLYECEDCGVKFKITDMELCVAKQHELVVRVEANREARRP